MPLKILRDLFQIKLKCFEVEQIFNFNTEITYFIFFFNCTHKTFLLDPLLSRRDERVLFATAHIKKRPTPSPKLINAIKISSYFVKFFLSKFFTKNSKFCSSFFVFITKDVSISKWKKKLMNCINTTSKVTFTFPKRGKRWRCWWSCFNH